LNIQKQVFCLLVKAVVITGTSSARTTERGVQQRSI
jgi:hypothetical protein